MKSKTRFLVLLCLVVFAIHQADVLATQTKDISLDDLGPLSQQWSASTDGYIIMWISAHPDDELFGAQCMFSRYCADYEERGLVIFVTCGGKVYSDTGTGDFPNSQMRRNEGICASSTVNADCRWLSLPGAGTGDHLADIRKRMARIIREVQPDIVFTHGPNGEYGHADHINTSNQVTTAVTEAADPTKYPAQLTNGVTIWDTPKFYRIRYDAYYTPDPETIRVDGNVYSAKLGQTYYDHSYDSLWDCYVSARFLFPSTYPPADYTSASWIRAGAGFGPTGNETDFLDNLSRVNQRPLYLRRWLICGSFDSGGGNMGTDYLTEDGGETGIAPYDGMATDGKVWRSRYTGRDLVNFNTEYAVNYNTVAYAYGKIVSPSSQSIHLRICYHDSVKVWLNGSLVYTNLAFKGWDSEESIPVTLNAGENTLLVKVSVGARIESTARPWAFFAKFDTTDWSYLDDTTPPDPDPMTWSSVPAPSGTTRITMTATTATDDSGVEYYFEEVSGNTGGSDSGWQDSSTYTDQDLLPNTQYQYKVKARDKSENQYETDWSSVESATTLPLPGTITDVACNSSGNIEITFEGGAASWNVESSTSPYDYNEANMTWTIDATGLSSGTWEDTGTPATGEKYYRLTSEGAGLIAYEPFDYSAGENLDGKNGYPDLWGGPWEGPPVASECSIVTTALNYPGLPTSGNSLDVGFTSECWTPLRPLAQPLTGTVWVSFVWKYTSPSNTDFWVGFDPTGSPPRATSSGLMIGTGWGNDAAIGDDRGGGSASTGITVKDGNVHLFVVRVDLDAGNAYLWVDPSTVDPEPSTGTEDAVFTGMALSSLNTIQLRGYIGTCGLDEIRIGSTWDSVIGTHHASDDTLGMMVSSLVVGRNMVSSPFEPYPAGGGTPGSSTLDKIVGTQLTGHPVSQWASDKIEAWDADLQTYLGAWLRAGQGWTAWDTMDSSPAFGIDSDAGYWIKINNVAKDVKLFGRVADENRSIEIQMNRNMVGSCFPVSCPLTQSNFVGSGFNGHAVSQWASDKLEFWNSAGQTYVGVWYRSGQGWRAWDSMDNPPAAPYDAIDPCEGWWIKVNNTPFMWDYPKPD